MQKKWKRWISLLLVFCMVLGMMPGLKVSAKMAADMTEAEAFEAGLDVYVAWSNYSDAYRGVVTDPITALMEDGTSAFNRLFKQIYPDGVENSPVLASAEKWLKDFYNIEDEFSQIESELIMSLLLSCVLYTGGGSDYSDLEEQVGNVLKNGLDVYEKVEEQLLECDDPIDIPLLELSGMGEFTFGILTDLAFGAIEEGKNYKEAIETAAKYDTIRSAAASDIDILREFEARGFLGKYVKAYTTAYDQLWETGESSFKEMLIQQNVNFSDMFSDILGTAVDAGLKAAEANASGAFIEGVVAAGKGAFAGFELFNIFEGVWKTSGDLLFGQSAMKKADLTLFYLDSVRKMFYYGYFDAYQDFRGVPSQENAKRLNTYSRLMYNVFAASEMYASQINDTYAKDGIFNAEWMHNIPGGIDPQLSDLAKRQSSTNRQRRENYLISAYAGYVSFANNSIYHIDLNLNGGFFEVTEQLGLHKDVVKISKIKTISQNIPNSIPIREGYEFLGWSTSSAATVGDPNYAPGKVYSQDADLTLYAVWKKITTISYRSSSGGGSIPSSHKNQGVVSSKWPTRSGYTFLGWSENSSYQEGDKLYTPGAAIDPGSSKILYAIWSRDPYLVTYDYNDNSADILDQISIQPSDPTIYTIASTRKDPARFKGWMIQDPNGSFWWTNGNWDNGKVSILQPGETVNLTGDMVLYAKWDYYVHYFDGETAAAHDEVSYAGAYELMDALPDQNGRKLKTWKVTFADGSFAYVEPGEIIDLQNDVNIYAVWQDSPLEDSEEDCTLSFHTNGGNELDAISGEVGSRVILPDSGDVYRQDYIFIGWAEDPGAVTKDYDGGDRYTLNGDATLYAVWKRVSDGEVEVSLSAATDQTIYEAGDTIILTVEVDNSDHFYVNTPKGSFTILRQDGLTAYHDGTFVEWDSPSAAYPDNRYRNGRAYEVEIYVDDDCEDGIYTFELKATDGILNSSGDGSVEGTVTSMVEYSLNVMIKEGGEDIVVDISPSKVTLHVDDRDRLSASVTPSAYKENLEWYSSNPDVVRVSSSGRLTAVSVGRATITAEVNGVSDSCTVIVEECSYDQKITTPDYLKSPAGCDSYALYYYSCECGYHGTETFEDVSGGLTEHQFGEWFTELYPTDELTGLSMRVCDFCGKEETEDIPVLKHQHDYWSEITAPTCSKDGYTTYICVDCGDRYVDSYAEALGHQYGEWYVTREGNICIAGEEQQDCERCNHYRTRATLTLPHIYEEVVTVPTCIRQGYSTYTCVICGDRYVDSYVDTIDHQFGEWLIERQPTETVAGLKVRACVLCGEKETEEIPVQSLVTLGDANGDVMVNNIDAMIVLQYAVGLIDKNKIDLSVADVNRDSLINNIDAMLILQYSVGLIDQFPSVK